MRAVLAGLCVLAMTASARAEDHSGQSRSGKASIYAHDFDGKKMADGRRFSPADDVAASKTLPLGTTAKVVNLDTGKSATVKVEDRGPHVAGRIIDVSPGIARQLDMTHKGVAPVEVRPIAVPQPDGAVKLGSGAAGTPAPEVREAVKTTTNLAR